MPTAKQVMAIANAQIGVKESPKNSNKTKYGKAFGENGVPWCFIFEWWCGDSAAKKYGGENPFPHSSNAAYGQDDIINKKGGKWVMKKTKSKATRKAALKKYKLGDCVDFDFGNMSAYRQHTGLVDSVEGYYVWCIEGNTSKSGSQSNGGMVVKQKRHYTAICSCARPNYDEESKEQKPAFEFPERGYYKKGDKGDGVKQMQKYLNHATKGAFDYTIKADGEFGDLTERACKFMQEVRHITVDGEFGKKSLAECKKKVTVPMMAVNFGVMIAKDPSFAYGTGERAHRYGCYFCQTNVGPKKKIKEKTGEPHYVKDKEGRRHTYEKTYCCNPFVTACYAHGAEVPAMLKACRAGSGGGLSVKTWTRYKCFKKVGACKKVPFEKLQVGDIILRSKHVFLYTGADWLVEASGEGWGKDTIAHKKQAKERYATYQRDNTAYVVRYKG